MADDEVESIYKNSGELADFHSHEDEYVNKPHNPGPLKKFPQRVSDIQKLENDKVKDDNSYKSIINISIVTARNAPSHKRVINTMRSWGISINEAFFMGGVEKSKVLNILKPHIFSMTKGFIYKHPLYCLPYTYHSE
ncbi:TPA: 5'-nucleotidase [Morganella morganii]|nr:5'-nucleotidase [Morganella morganii]